MSNRYLVHMRNAAQKWYNFYNVGPSPSRRSCHAMASDGTRIFVLGGYSKGALADDISLIHVFDTSMYYVMVISSGRNPILRKQSTSSILLSSIPMRRSLNLHGSHPQVHQPRCNHSTRHPLHRKLALFHLKTLPPSYRAALPRRKSLTSEIPVRRFSHCNPRV